MGHLVEGRWQDDDTLTRHGAYRRAASALPGVEPEALAETIAASPGRFHLIASMSCPWSHRAMMVRALKGLKTEIPLSIAGGPRVEGYALNGGRPCAVPGTGERLVHLHELYSLSEPGFTGRATVPVLWDGSTRRIASNSSDAIMRAFDRIPAPPAKRDFTLVPAPLRTEIETLNAELYESLNNAVYRAGFATAQAPYEDAVGDVFEALDRLEARLARNRYLFGAILTESDLRLFATLVRFDSVYAVLFKCSLRRLVDYPALWAYARDLHGWRGIAGTVDFDTNRIQSYLNDQAGASPIVAVMPDADWTAPHGRESLGPARIALRNGDTVAVDPTTLEPV